MNLMKSGFDEDGVSLLSPLNTAAGTCIWIADTDHYLFEQHGEKGSAHELQGIEVDTRLLCAMM